MVILVQVVMGPPKIYFGAMNRTDRNVYALSPHVTPYNDFLFRETAKHIPKLMVIYRARILKSHPWKQSVIEGYRHRFGRTFLGIDWGTMFMPILDPKAFFWVAGWDSPTSFVALTLMRALRRDFAVWTDTPRPVRKGGRFKERLRAAWIHWLFSGATAVMSTGIPGVNGVIALGAPREKVLNFPFVLDLSVYQRSAQRDPENSPVKFVSSGRVQNWLKGHDIAIRAFAEVSQRCQRSFEYSIAGTGPDLESVKTLAKELGISHVVKCLGWTEPAQLREILLSSHVLVHPSPVHDPFPNAVLEGMAAGMAVLGSAVSGSVLDRVQDGVHGFIHQPGDVGQLAQHIELLLTDPTLLKSMGCSSEAVARNWSADRATAIIRGLVEGKSLVDLQAI